ncbi:MAG: hypothetical protein Tsb0013_18610 [Phycisphaerales bacterium]
MRFLRQHDGRPRVMPMDITSLVDVVFLLIVFFLTTSSLVEMSRARLDLPEEQGEEEIASESPGLVVNISADGAYIVENERVTLARTVEMVRAEIEKAGGPAGVDLLLRADKYAPLVHLNALARELVELGLASWRMGTQLPQGAGSPTGGTP